MAGCLLFKREFLVIFERTPYNRGKIKAVCGDLGHCSLLFKSDTNAFYLLPNAVYWL